MMDLIKGAWASMKTDKGRLALAALLLVGVIALGLLIPSDVLIRFMDWLS